MTKSPRSQYEIKIVQDKILQSAMDIIKEEGFDKLSMRNLASRMNMSATNLYSYYSNKEGILLALEIRAFKELYQKLINSIENKENHFEKLKASIRAYVEFGTDPNNIHIYDLMFNRFTPKLDDYIGTPHEKLARFSSDQANRGFLVILQLITEYANINPNLKGKNPILTTLRLWSELHGIISFYNSGILLELSHIINLNKSNLNPKSILDEVIKQLIFSIEKVEP